MSFPDPEPRFRLAVKQTAKNLWQIDATLEFKSDKIERHVNDNDKADIVKEPLGLRLLSMIKEAEKAFRGDGRMLIGDENGRKD